MDSLEEAAAQLSSFIPRFEAISTNVSEATAGWHIAHSYLVINGIISALKKSDPKDYRYSFNLSRLFIRVKGSFPRGRGKAPERVKPAGDINAGLLQELAAKTKTALPELAGLHKNAHFKHPYFGILNKKSTIWFLKVHTRHHYQIIKDILR